MMHEPPLTYWTATAVGRRIYELKLALSVAVRDRRRALGLSQKVLAERLSCTQGRVSKLERCCGHTTIDFAIAALVALDASDAEIGAAVTNAVQGPAGY